MSRLSVSVVISADTGALKTIEPEARRAGSSLSVLNREIGFVAQSARQMLAGQKFKDDAERMAATAAALTRNLEAYKNKNSELTATLAGGLPAIDAARQKSEELARARELASRAAAAGYDPESKLGQEYIQQIQIERNLIAQISLEVAARDKAAAVAREQKAAEEALAANIAKTTASEVAQNASLERLIAASRRGQAAFARQKAEEEALNRVSQQGIAIGAAQVADLTREIAKRRELESALKKEEAALEKANRASSFTSGFKGLASQVAGALGLAGGILTLKSVFSQMVSEISESQAAFAQLEAGVRSTGGAAGLSAQELSTYAGELQKLTGIDDEAIQGAQAVLLTFTRIGREAFGPATRAVLDLSTRLGTDLNSAALQVGKALNDPVKGVTSLAKAGVQFSAAQKETIKTLVETGHLYQAQLIILKELETQVGGSAEAFRKTLPGALAAVKNAWGDLLESLGAGLAPALSGIADGIADALSSGDLAARAQELGRTIGEAFGLMAQGARWLIENLDRLKAFFTFLAVVKTASVLFAVAEAFQKIVLAFKAVEVAAELAKLKVLGFNAAFLVSPLGLVVVGLAALSAGMVYYTSTTRAAHEAELQQLSLHQKTLSITELLTSATQRLSDAQRTQVYNQIAALNAARDLAREQVRSLESPSPDKKPFWLGGTSFSLKPPHLVQDLEDAKGRLREIEADLNRLWAAVNVYAKATGDAAKLTKDFSAATGELAKDLAKLRLELAEDLRYQQELLKLYSRGPGLDLSTRIKEEHRITLEHQDRVQLRQDEEKYGRVIASQLQAERQAVRAVTEEVGLLEHATRKLPKLDVASQVRSLFDSTIGNDAVRLQAALAGVKRAFDQTIPIATIQRAQQIIESTLTSEERRNLALTEAKRLLDAGVIGAETYRRVLQSYADPLTEQVARLATIRNLWASIGTAVQDSLGETGRLIGETVGRFVVTWKADLHELGRAIRDTFANALAQTIGDFLAQWFQAFARWLLGWRTTQKIAQVESAKTTALSSSNQGSGGGGWNWLTLFRRPAASTNSTSLAPATINGSAGYSLSYGSSASSTTGSSAAGGLAAMGATLAIFAAIYFGVKTWIDHHQREFEQFRIQGSGTGSLSWVLGSGNNSIKHLGAVADGMVKTVSEVIRVLGGYIAGWTGDLTVSRSGHGKHTRYWVQYAEGMIESFGNDAEAAFQFAMVQAVRQADIRGLPAEVQTAIRSSAARTMDQLQAEIEKAMQLVANRLGDVGFRVYEIFKKYALSIDEQIKAGIKLLENPLGRSVGTGGAGGAGVGSGAVDGPGGGYTKALAKEDVAATSSQINAVRELIAARNVEVASIRNQLLGVNDSSSKRLADIASFNRGIVEAQNLVNAQMAQVQEQLSALGDKSGEAADKLRTALQAYLVELQNMPQQIQGEQLNMAIFDTLYQYLKGSGKYAEQANKYAILKVELEFAAIKAQLIALGKWEEFAGMFDDAYRAARDAAGHAGRGSGRGQERADARESALDRLEDLRNKSRSDAARIMTESARAERAWREEAKKGAITSAELTEALRLERAERTRALREGAEQLAGIGTSFTQELSAGRKYFDDLRRAGRKETGLPNWLVELLEGKFLARMGQSFQQSLNEFNGISDPMLDIQAKAEELRQNLFELAKSAGWSAQQIADAEQAIARGAEFQRGRAINSVLGRLFDYVKDLPGYSSQVVEFKKAEVELEFKIYEAQLRTLGAWDEETERLWRRAKEIAVSQASAITQARFKGYDDVATTATDLAKAQQSAADRFKELVTSLVDANREILTGAQSSLAPEEKYQTALTNYLTTLAKAQGGNSEALASIVGIRSTLLTVAQQYFAGGAGNGLGAGYDQLLRQTVRDFAGLALSPEVEQKTIQDLLAREVAATNAAAAQNHADLTALRADMFSLLSNLGVSGIVSPNSAPFAAAYVLPPLATPFAAPAPSTFSSENGEILRTLQAMERRLQALEGYAKKTAEESESSDGHLELLAANSESERMDRSLAKGAPR